MASDKTLGSRIPFEDIESFSSWQPPTLGGNRVVPSVKKKDEKKSERRPAAGEQIVEEVSDHPTTPMTAEQLRQLTESAEKEAREEGFAQGYEEGMKQGEKKGTQLGEQKAFRETREKLSARSQAFEALAQALFKPVNEHEGELENTLITMAVELARHFIHSELSINPSLMFATVEQAVASLPAGARDIQVRVSPEDLVHVEEAFTTKREVWNFVADAQIARGGCRVDSAFSSVDFSFEKRIQNWRESLLATTDAPPPETAINDYRPVEAAQTESAQTESAQPEAVEPEAVDAEAARDEQPAQGETFGADGAQPASPAQSTAPHSDADPASPDQQTDDHL